MKIIINRKSGFTLLEVLLAVVIFSLVIGAVYSTFRAGLQMHKIGSAEKETFQKARILHNLTQRDFRSILAIEETYYDIPPFPIDTTENPYFDFTTDTSWVLDETLFSLSPFPFLGTLDSVSLYSYGEVPLGSIRGLRQGIFHIQYNLKNNKLYRSTDEITGNISDSEMLVDNINFLEFNYGYGKEGNWYWVEQWDSRRDKFRNPKSDDDAEALFDYQRRSVVRVYPDNLPNAVRVRVRLQEPDNPRAEGREIEWITKIPAAKPLLIQQE